MVDFLKKRLQVFVSSTYSDLISERQAAVEAILTAGHIPAGMELFAAGDESQMEVIKQWIDESDVFLLILGGRYGSIEPKTGKSYIELEYQYALKQKKPLFACVIFETALDAKIRENGKDVFEQDNPQKLKNFKETILGKICRFWEDRKDIKIAVSEKLAEFSRIDDLKGWVRGGQDINTVAFADEIARLSKENADLRSQIYKNGESQTAINGLTFSELKTVLEHKRLLTFLIRNSVQLASGEYQPTIVCREIKELCKIGLCSRNFQMFELTESGRKFLNKLDLEQITCET